MNLIIGSKSTKIFIKALKFLAKFSSEYYFEAKNNELVVKTLGNNQISLACATFKDLFFVRYEEASNEEDNVCRVSAKILLTILKQINKVASLNIKLDIDNDCMYCNIHKFNDFVIKNKILLLEFEEVEPYKVPPRMNELTCQPSLFRRVLQSSRIDELQLQFQKDCVHVQSFIDQPDDDCEAIRLNYTIDVMDFISYDLTEENTLVVSCGDLNCLLSLAQSLNMDITMNFSHQGRPMVSKIKNDGPFSMSLFQATLPPRSLARRNLRNNSYKEVVMDYMGKKVEPKGSELSVTDSGILKATDPSIDLNSPEDIVNMVEPSQPQNEGNKTKSTEQTYISTPSSRHGNKRKSSEAIEIAEAEDLNATKDDLLKRRKTQLNPLNSTVIGNGTILSQNEVNEMNDILANIDEYCEEPMEQDPIPAQQPRPISQSESFTNFRNISQNDVEMREVQNTENVHRWPMHNSYFHNSDDVVAQKENLEVTKNPVISKPIRKIFGTLFKPRSKHEFGRKLVESDSDQE